MIYHLSIPAQDPRQVAIVMGELMGGRVMHFVPGGPDTYVVFSPYGAASSIEIVPLSTLHTPGSACEPMRYDMAPEPPGPFSGFHVAMASPLSATSIQSIATREGWRALECWRSTAFPLVEVWLENRIMVEFFAAEMQQRMLEFSTPENWQKTFGLVEVDGIHVFPAFHAQHAV